MGGQSEETKEYTYRTRRNIFFFTDYGRLKNDCCSDVHKRLQKLMSMEFDTREIQNVIILNECDKT